MVLLAVMVMPPGVPGAVFAGAAVPTIWKPGNFRRCTLSPWFTAVKVAVSVPLRPVNFTKFACVSAPLLKVVSVLCT